MYNASGSGRATTASSATRCCWSASTEASEPDSVVEAGEAADRPCEGGHVVVAVTPGDQARLQLRRQGADRQ